MYMCMKDFMMSFSYVTLLASCHLNLPFGDMVTATMMLMLMLSHQVENLHPGSVWSAQVTNHKVPRFKQRHLTWTPKITSLLPCST